MPVELDNAQPLAWDSPDLDADTRAMLDNLQANILQPHVRDHMSLLLLRFDDADDGRRFLRCLVPLMKSARQHLEEVRSFRLSKAPGTVYVGVGISADGYRALGHDLRTFADNRFQKGMKQADILNDPPAAEWEAPYRQEVHAIVLIGDSVAETVAATRAEILDLLPATATLLGEETGLGMRNPAGKGIEHFGYVDGRSQPLFLADQVAAERSVNWNPFFPLKHALRHDPLAPDPNRHFGSYLVFRKLEQNVRAFRQAEEELADRLGLTGEDRARAGAMLVGRFRNGTPLRLHGKPSSDGWPTQNDFNYAKDPDGAKCPILAHIRKMSPRDSRDGGLERIREVAMPRRGQTYGTRTDDPWDDAPPETRPTGGVGLLFMAFNGDLRQFETAQLWANDDAFPQEGVGLDPVIGQGERTLKVRFPTVWGGPEFSPPVQQVPQTVTMKGGEYFFAPSLAYLNSL
jgi:Predicted iron-dependent peroxidase